MKLPSLLPQERKFFMMLADVAKLARESSELLNTLVNSQNPDQIARTSAAISRAKAQAKKLNQQITEEVCRSFITPFDREDIQEFAYDLYSISKLIEKVKNRLIVHQLEASNDDFDQFITIILKASEALNTVVGEISNDCNPQTVTDKAAILHELEEEADELLGQQIEALFTRPMSQREVFLRKDIYDMLENIVDYHRNAANVAVRIILKHS